MQLSALYRYPLKSARGESLTRSPLEALGLRGDRRWMLVEPESGRFLTQRLLPQMSQLSALYNADGGLSLSAPGFGSLEVALPQPDQDLRGVTVWRDSLRVPDAGDAAAEWLSAFIGRPCRLVQVPEARARQVDTGYAQPGDKVAFSDGFPLLLIGQASLDDLSRRLDSEDEDVYRNLFQTKSDDQRLPVRRGYVLGWWIARHLGQAHSLQEMAEWDGPTVRRRVGEALATLRAQAAR